MATPLTDRVRPGDSFSETHRFDAEAIADFARRTGDRNPVHTDPAAGTSSRFGKRIASAQHIVSQMLGFTAAVREDDSVVLRWTVSETVYKESLRGMIVVLDGTATNEQGLVCAHARLEMLLQD